MAGKPSHSEILKTFAGIVSRSLQVEAERVTEDAYLDDLGAESLDLIEITMGVEESFDIWISEKSILQTARDVFGAGVLENGTQLTEAGKALLLARMPELDPQVLEGDVQLADVNRQFMRVSGWLRMIEGLVAVSPSACTACGGALGPAVAFKRKCEQCGAQHQLVSGEEVNRKWVENYRDSLPAATVPAVGA